MNRPSIRKQYSSASAPTDHNVLWLGSGEGDPRNSVGYGNGVYRSTDGGRSWTHLGLDDTERIKRIVVHPGDPDTALYAVLVAGIWSYFGFVFVVLMSGLQSIDGELVDAARSATVAHEGV